MEDNEKQWFVVHTYSGYEERVKKNLEQRVKSMDTGDDILQVIIPTEDEIEVKNGQRRTVTKKILPGYVLIEMKMKDESWSLVRNTPGVTGFVGSGNKPTPLAEEEVNDGPFIDFVGLVDEISPEKGKVKVLLSLFGRETPVELDFLQVEKL